MASSNQPVAPQPHGLTCHQKVTSAPRLHARELRALKNSTIVVITCHVNRFVRVESRQAVSCSHLAP
jgi:hypothetical protein